MSESNERDLPSSSPEVSQLIETLRQITPADRIAIFEALGLKDNHITRMLKQQEAHTIRAMLDAGWNEQRITNAFTEEGRDASEFELARWARQDIADHFVESNYSPKEIAQLGIDLYGEAMVIERLIYEFEHVSDSDFDKVLYQGLMELGWDLKKIGHVAGVDKAMNVAITLNSKPNEVKAMLITLCENDDEIQRVLRDTYDADEIDRYFSEFA